MSSVFGGGDTGAGEDAAFLQAQYQQKALDYLKQQEKLPTAFREGALKDLGSLYGLNYQNDGSIISDGKSIIDRAQESPFYTTAVQRGEDAVLRNASATGGLRSGNAQSALADVNQSALLSAYQDQLSGLQGLSSLPSNANNIANLTAGIGSTLAQGQVASANAANAAGQNTFNNLIGLGGLGLSGAAFFSDRRLKDNITALGIENGHNKYAWQWNDQAKALGLAGSAFGVMADEVEKTHPHAVSMRDGYKVVDYSALGVSHGI
jgi:hypothetical protein